LDGVHIHVRLAVMTGLLCLLRKVRSESRDPKNHFSSSVFLHFAPSLLTNDTRPPQKLRAGKTSPGCDVESKP